MPDLYLGLDVSTQSTKLLLLDYESRQPIFVTSMNYDTDLPQYETENGAVRNKSEGISESDPQMWIDALHTTFDRLKDSEFPVADVKAISVSGQQHGLVCMDAKGNLTRNTAKLWNDVSTLGECREITRAVGGEEKVIKEIFNSMRPGYTAGKILHFKKEDPRAFDRTFTFFLVHNYVNWYLTGGKDVGVRVMEPGDTSGMGLWNPKTRTWSKAVCEAIDGNLISRLPKVEASDEFIGRIGREFVEKYGFSSDCRIDAGSGDNMYGAVGTGNVEPGVVTVSLGTSGTAFTVLREPYADPSGEIASFCDSLGNVMPLLCVSNLANGYNKILETHGITHEQFSDIITQTPTGNSGRILLPWFTGERTPDLPNARPLYFGFGLEDFTRKNLCRAVLEGHVLNLYEGFRRLPVKARTVHLTGGMSKSPAWRQTIADIFGVKVIPVKGEGAALGAAIHAAYVDNKDRVKSIGDFVSQFVRFDETARTNPAPDRVSAVEKLKNTYQALSQRVRGVPEAGDPFSV